MERLETKRLSLSPTLWMDLHGNRLRQFAPLDAHTVVKLTEMTMKMFLKTEQIWIFFGCKRKSRYWFVHSLLNRRVFFFIVVNVSTLESSLNPTDNGSHALQVQRQVVEEMFSSLCLLRTKKPQWDQDVVRAGALHRLQLYRPHQAKQCDHNKHNCCQLQDWLWYVDIHFTWEQ